MKRFIRTQHEIDAPVNKVWNKIAQGDGVEEWLPIIKSSRVDDNNQRFCVMHEGGDLEETYLLSEGNRTFMYRIDRQEAFPATNIVGTMKVEALENDRTLLYWDVEMELEAEEVFAELKQNIEQIYAASAANLSKVA